MPKDFPQKVLALAESRVKHLSKVTIIDQVIDRFFLWMIPWSVTPNQVTMFRFISIPFVIWLFLTEQYGWGLLLFSLSAFSDAVDGAMARTRKQVTRWGILADPLADKLLIGSASLILVSHFIGEGLAFFIVLLEVFMLASAYYRYNGKVVPAKVPAKIKMILQCFGVIFLLLYVVTQVPLLLGLAVWTLYGAVIFALLSLLVYRSI